MDFKTRELKFGYKDKAAFDPDAVKKALDAENFSRVELIKQAE